MKRYIYYFMAFLILPFVSSCENDTDGPTVTEITHSVITNLPSGVFDLSEYDADDDNPLLFTLRWTPTEFQMKGSDTPQGVAPIEYSIQIDRAGNAFADAATFAATNADTVDVFRKDLNDFMMSQLKLEASETYNLELRLFVKFGEGNNEYNQIYSQNTVSFNAIPSDGEGVPFIYLIGDMNGWNNTNTDFPMFRDDSQADNTVYTYTGRIAENTYYKFIPASSLGSWKVYYDGGDGNLVLGENEFGAFHILNEGYYTITIDIKALTMEVAPYNITGAKVWNTINFVGAFCEWGNSNEPDMVPTSYDPHIWTLEVELSTIEYGVKFRAEHSFGNKWCPKYPSAIPFGVCNYNPDDDPNISLDETGTGTYFVVFNDLTGHYIISKQ